MQHYFDDIFTRHVTQSKSGKDTPHRNLRRSSTNRSIGARSDFGGEDDHRPQSAHSVDPVDGDLDQAEANAHIAQYVSSQLERVRSNGSANEFYDQADEFEAQLDEK